VIAALLSLALVAAPPALSPEQEDRANALMDEIRCVVCDGQPISESNADIAKDMRVILLEQVAEGRSDQEIRDWMADRYGDGVLLRPRTSGPGLYLWAAPLVLIALVALALSRVMRIDRSVNQSDQDEA